MIVCSCNRISDTQITCEVDRLIDDDKFRLLTPGVVYKALGARPRCGACLPNAACIIQNYVNGVAACAACPLRKLASAKHLHALEEQAA